MSVVVPCCNFHILCENCSYILCTSVLKSRLTRLCSVNATLPPLYCVLQRLGLKYASDILSWQHLPTVGWDSSSRWWPCQHEPVWSSGFTEPKVPHPPSQTPFYAAAQTHEVSRYFSSLMYSLGACGGVVVKALRYTPAGCGFDSRWCHWNFSVT